jgi:hypothetical protein
MSVLDTVRIEAARIILDMQPRRHRMRKQQRRDSARGWINSGATVTVKAYAKRYGVDRYTAYDDLTALGFSLPASAQHWATRPPATPRHSPTQPVDDFDDGWIMLDGRRFFVVGYTSGGAPYGVFDDEIPPDDLSGQPARSRDRDGPPVADPCGVPKSGHRG